MRLERVGQEAGTEQSHREKDKGAGSERMSLAHVTVIRTGHKSSTGRAP
jgi:hypothetical protein